MDNRFELKTDLLRTTDTAIMVLGVIILIGGLMLVAFNYEGITAISFGLFLIVMGQGFITNAKIRSLKRELKELEDKE